MVMSRFAVGLVLAWTTIRQVLAGSIVLGFSPNHSLRAPYDTLNSKFLSSGDVVPSATEIRLGHPRPHNLAALWCRQQNIFAEWQVLVAFRVQGDKDGGGEGLAFWYARNLGQAGPVYGGPNKWHGLGIFIDTNSGTDQRVMGALSAGDVDWRMEKGGEGQYFGGCLARIRNTITPVHMRITYINRVLKVELDDSKEGASFANCLERANTDLPPGHFFGLSAGIGDNPDSFDVLSFEVFQLKRDANTVGNQVEQTIPQSNQSSNSSQYDMTKQLSLMQSNINTLIGQLMPGDRPVLQRLDGIEQQVKGLQDKINGLSELITKMISKSAAVDPGALLHTLHDIRENTRTQLQSLAIKAGAAEQQAQHIAQVVSASKKTDRHMSGYIVFVLAQIILLFAYHLIRGRYEEKSRKFV